MSERKDNLFLDNLGFILGITAAIVIGTTIVVSITLNL
jgi:hypothetical protein